MCVCVVQLMMPVFWAAEEGALTKSLAKEFKDTVYLAKYGMETAVWAGVGLGGVASYHSNPASYHSNPMFG